MVRRRKAAAGLAAASAIQSLAERMANMQVTSGRRRRRRRGRQPGALSAVNNIPGAEGSPSLVVGGSSRRGRRRNNRTNIAPNIGNGGQITLARCELFTGLTIKANTGFTGLAIPLTPTTDVMTYLYRLCQCYTRLRWNYLNIEWRPACGTTQNGIVTFGLRLMEDRANPTAAPTDRKSISALTPVSDNALWQPSQLPIPKRLLMTRTWYATTPSQTASGIDQFDLSPGTLMIGAQSSAPTSDLFAGEFWVTYSVTLDGTRSEN